MNTILIFSIYGRGRAWAAGYAFDLQSLQERYKIIYRRETAVLPAPKGVDLPVGRRYAASMRPSLRSSRKEES